MAWEKDEWDKEYLAWKEAKGRSGKRENKEEKPKVPEKQAIRKEIEALGLQSSGRKVFREAEKIEDEIIREYIRPKKKFIVVVSLIIILGIFVFLAVFTLGSSDSRFSHVDIEAKGSNGLPMNVYFKSKAAFGFSGWESMLFYEGNDRVYGNDEYRKIIFDNTGKAYTYIRYDDQVKLEQLTSDPSKVTRIGWFTQENEINIQEQTSLWGKIVAVGLDSEDLDVTINYNLIRWKPYFTSQVVISAEKKEELGDFGYGFVLRDSDIYLSNGSILNNDNIVVKTDKKIFINAVNLSYETINEIKGKINESIDLESKVIERNGTSYDLKADYELFPNWNENTGILVFSEGESRFENSFKWNVYRIYADHNEDNVYNKVYFVFLENMKIEWDAEKGDWKVKSRYFDGYLTDYIKKIKKSYINEI